MRLNTNLLDLVPNYYSELLESREILTTEDLEFLSLNSNIEDILMQFRIGSATWGIVYWEDFVGLIPDPTKSIEERRSNVRAKIRGPRTVTVEQIKSICESYVNGEVSVTEDNVRYRVLIKFIDTHGQPTNIEDIKKILREVIPAHIAIEYEFLYNVYSDYAPMPYSEIMDFTYDELMNISWEYDGKRNSTLGSSTNEELEIYINEDMTGGFTIV